MFGKHFIFFLVLDNEYKALIHNTIKSDAYEKVVKQLSNIEKKIKYIKKDLYDYIIKQDSFKNLIDDLNSKIKEICIQNINLKKFNEIKESQKQKIMSIEIVPKIKLYIVIDNFYKDKSEVKNFLKTLTDNRIEYKYGNDLSILKDKNPNYFKIIICFVKNGYIKDVNNYLIIISLRDYFYINKFNTIIIYKESNKNIEAYNNFLGLKLESIEKYEALLNILEEIKSNNYKKDIYNKYIKLIEDQIFYKFLINEYILLFKKSIYCNNIKFNEKNELILIKINQDIQFLKNFEFNNNINLDPEIINDFANLFKNDDTLLNLAKNFIKHSKILIEIKNTLIEFEERISKKIDITKSKNKDKNQINNIITDDENQNSDIENDENNIKNDKNKIINTNEKIINYTSENEIITEDKENTKKNIDNINNISDENLKIDSKNSMEKIKLCENILKKKKRKKKIIKFIKKKIVKVIIF